MAPSSVCDSCCTRSARIAGSCCFFSTLRPWSRNVCKMMHRRRVLEAAMHPRYTLTATVALPLTETTGTRAAVPRRITIRALIDFSSLPGTPKRLGFKWHIIRTCHHRHRKRIFGSYRQPRIQLAVQPTTFSLPNTSFSPWCPNLVVAKNAMPTPTGIGIR
jgi:hypothetical protein